VRTDLVDDPRTGLSVEAIRRAFVRPRRSRARQRRPRPARGLLHGLAGHAADPGDRLRHPLRVRHLRPGDRRRLAGGDGDTWLRNGNPWEIPRPESRFGGLRRPHRAVHRRARRDAHRWVPRPGGQRRRPTTRRSSATASSNVNLLRLWKAEAPESFDFQAFNVGDYYGAVHAKMEAETISKVLYPNDEPLRQGAAPEAAVLLRLLLAAGHDPAAARHRRQPRRLPRGSLRCSSTTPIRHRGRGADAPADGRARHGLGPGLGGHPQRHALHQSHPAAGGARDLVGGSLFERPAAAAPRDHLRDQPALPGRGAGPLPGRRARRRDCRSIERAAEAASAWRTSPRWAARPSTASRRCTRTCSKTVLRDFYELWPEKFSNKSPTA
jgi:hypothetical protein